MDANADSRAAAGWRLGPTVLDVQVVDHSRAFAFAGIAGIVVLRNGTVVVSDAGSQQLIYVLNDETQPVTTGGRGRGPGEFEGLGWIGECRPNYLYAFDYSLARVSVFDSTGIFVRSFTFRATNGVRIPYSLACNEAGEFLVMGWHNPRRRVGPYRPPAPLDIFDDEGRHVVSLGWFPTDERYVYRRGTGPRPLGKTTELAMTSTAVYLGFGDTSEIRMFNVSGAEVMRITYPWEPVSVGPKEVMTFVEAQLQIRRDQEWRERNRRLFLQLEYPDRLPAYSRFVVDGQGSLWIEEYPVPGSKEIVWHVIDNDLRYLGRLRLPNVFKLFAVENGHLFGTKTDRDGIEHLEVRLAERVGSDLVR